MILRNRWSWLATLMFLFVFAEPAASSEAQMSGAAVGFFAADSASPTVRLEIDPSSQVAFLSMIFRGGGLGEQRVFTFFGDGLVRVERFRGHNAPVLIDSTTAQLSGGDLDGMLAEIVAGRLLEASSDEIAERIRSQGAIARKSEEGEVILVNLSLLARRPEEQSSTTVSNSFVVDGSSIREPLAEEWESLSRIADFAIALGQTASGGAHP